ncbi:acyltransferase [Sulfurovum sp. XGS-02]|uniref:acyltransferase n=1 Tax=Sulfurovum sp. XGS-02 TaxID=2925411 RepID=UPI00206251A6|nr:acyltransferase [Sulfurovum sp. XGS-02]UPT77643.1 acyltransferase [Sulfurovum sp. XGS-02]
MYVVEQFYRKILKKDPPYYAKYSLITIIWKPLRKYINVVIIPNTPFSNLRVILYRMLGFKIGNNVFIGMKCYMDDMDPEKTIIEDDVVISYGCYFACHGKGQGHTSIVIEKGAYLGMRCNVISGKNGIVIGKNSIVGAGSLVNKSITENTSVAGIPAKMIVNEK